MERFYNPPPPRPRPVVLGAGVGVGIGPPGGTVWSGTYTPGIVGRFGCGGGACCVCAGPFGDGVTGGISSSGIVWTIGAICGELLVGAE